GRTAGPHPGETGSTICPRIPLPRLRRTLEDPSDDRVGIDSFSLSFEIQEKARPKRAVRDCADILARHVHAFLQKGTNLPADNKRLSSSRARAIPRVLHS